MTTLKNNLKKFELTFYPSNSKLDAIFKILLIDSESKETAAITGKRLAKENNWILVDIHLKCKKWRKKTKKEK